MKRINSIIKRLWINKSAIWKSACAITGVVFTIWGFVSLFDPLDGVFDEGNSPYYKLLIGFLVLLGVFILSSVIAGIRQLSSNQICIGESSTKKKVYVKYGDMYSPDIIEKGYNGKRAIVVAVNRCFDTIVDKHLVSHNTLHGKLFLQLYAEGKYTPESLDNAISGVLRRTAPIKVLTPAEKPKGNRKRYDVGTTVSLRIDDNLSYYLLGLSSFDERMNAHTTKAEFALAIQRLIEFCNRNSQGDPVVLPLLGSGLSRTNIELKDILHYLVDAFSINRDIINNDFYIVVWKGDKDKVAIKELRKW